MSSGAVFRSGDRVFHKEHPEFGFGWIKTVEEDFLGDVALSVDFEHLTDRKTLGPGELQTCNEFLNPADAAAMSSGRAVIRRFLCGAVLGDNNLTGAFLHTSTKPLPHQAFALEKVLSKNRFGHLFADDVGMGKTIEAGLLISALRRSNMSYRVLIVCPAGLVQQWKDEMVEHFALYFSIVGTDFNGRRASNWKNQHLVIASLDAIKRDDYKEILEQVPTFDLVICDEGHRLSARRSFLSGDLEKTANYVLFERLIAQRTIEMVEDNHGVKRSPRLLLLSATPHQGDDLRFRYLLNLLRPDLFPVPAGPKDALPPVEPTAIKETVTRTARSVARDWDNKPLFEGLTTRTVDVAWTKGEVDASNLLTKYILKSLSGTNDKKSALIVQLVMHTFHKIAASSWFAIGDVLSRRKDSLTKEMKEAFISEEEDDLEIGEQALLNAARMFFWDEDKRLQELIEAIDHIEVDSKLRKFMEVLDGFEALEPGCHVLIFTQYKATQRYLQEKLNARYPNSVRLINGEMSLNERHDSRRDFEQQARFLISTEAGGEGINLQRASHHMINYDLAWNPMRLQQRIGRLDRYGQKNKVQVVNLCVPDSWDAKISLRIMERLISVQQTMGQLTVGFEDYFDMLLGRIAEQMNPTDLFMQHISNQKDIDDKQIDEWANKGLAGLEMWKNLFTPDLGVTEATMPHKTELTAFDFREAYSCALEAHKIKLSETRTSEKKYIPQVYHYELPQAFRDPLVRATRQFYVVFDRDVFNEVRGEVIGQARGQEIKPSLAGFSEPVTDWLFETAFNAASNESVTSVNVKAGVLASGWLLAYALRWRIGSTRMRAPDSFCFVSVPDNGESRVLTSRQVFDALIVAEASDFIHDEAIPTEPTLQLVRETLIKLIKERGGNAKAIAGLFLHAAIRVRS